jgi:hypothetical protein
MTDEITRACETCKHESKSAVQDPCRNCLPSPRLPSWQPAEVEQTPAARIAELEAGVAKLREALAVYANDNNWLITNDDCLVAEWMGDSGCMEVARRALGLPLSPEAE